MTPNYADQTKLQKKINFFNRISKKNKIKLFFAGLLIAVIAIFLIAWSFWEFPLTSPIASNSLFEFINIEEILKKNEASNKIVYGFLPYWNIEQVTIQPELTHLSYFGLNISEDGTILTTNEDGTLHPGYARLQSEKLLELAQEMNRDNNQFEITLVQFESKKIEQIVNNPEAHQNLITALDSLLLAYPISGINIDIEYNGSASEELRNNFALLIETIRQHLNNKFGNVQLSVDVYASASNNRQIWDIPRISRSVDYIIVMAYDFHRRSSPQAGPVAPLFSSNDSWSDDIHKNLREFLRYVPKEKILLGIPFYGYEWRVDSWSPYANTYPNSGVTASYQRVKKLLENQNLQIETGWDKKALCPYIIYVKDDHINVIYYENPISIEYKLEYVKQLDLAGITIWALGYEGQDRDLWDVVSKL